MKRFGSTIKSEITRKQINTIYSANKRGDVKIEPIVMKALYDHTERTYTSASDNDVIVAVIDHDDAKIKAIITAIFANDFAKAQEVIDDYSKDIIEAVNYEKKKKFAKKQTKTKGAFKPRFTY